MPISLSKKVAGFVGALVLACGGMAQAQPSKIGSGDTIPMQEPAAQIVDAPLLIAGPAFNDAPTNSDTGLNIGVGFYLMKPFFQSNAAITRTIQLSPPGGSTSLSIRTEDFRYDCTVTPRVFAHLVSDSGLGARVGWWHFDQTAAVGATNTPNPPNTTAVFTFGAVSEFSLFGATNTLAAGQTDVFSLRDRFVTDVWDFDITARMLNNERWNVTVGAGIRYAYIAKHMDTTRVRTGLAAGQVNDIEEHSRNLFNGGGPDVFIEAKRYLGNSGLSLYTNLRVGALFGEQRDTVSRVETTGPGPAGISLTDIQNGRDNHIVSFVDTEAGIEWRGSGRGSLQPFARIGVVGQGYFGFNGPEFLFAGFDGPNHGFFGFSFMGGVNY